MIISTQPNAAKVDAARKKLLIAALNFSGAQNTANRNPTPELVDRCAEKMLELCDRAADFADAVREGF